MALTRKLLKSMGIEDEKIDQIIEAHSESVDALKEERDKYRDDAAKLPEIQKKLEAAEKQTSGEDSYKVKYEALKEDFDKYKGEVTAKETRGAKEKALKSVLKKVGVLEECIDDIAGITKLDTIELDKDGKIANPDALEKSIREKYGKLITTTGKKENTPENPPTGGGKTPMTREDIMKITDTSKRQAAIAENIELFNS